MADAEGPKGNHRIYLAGPVEQTDDPRTWRDVVKERFPDLSFIDPMDFQEDWHQDPEGVIAKELSVCESSPILACNIGSECPRTVGTHHEIAHALAHGNTRIAAVVKGRVPGFIEHRPIAVFEEIEDALAHLTDRRLAAEGGQI